MGMVYTIGLEPMTSEPGKDGGPATLVLRERDSQATFAHRVPEKGVGDGYIVKRVLEDIDKKGVAKAMRNTSETNEFFVSCY